MSEKADELRRVLLQALSGRGAHVLVREALEGLDAARAGRREEGEPHSIFQILNHLVYWQDFALAWIDGSKPPTPEHAADSWPGGVGPEDDDEWHEAAGRFAAGLDALEERARDLDLFERRGEKSVLEVLQLIASHNSYHVGQIAAARRAAGAWPPPGGGATW